MLDQSVVGTTQRIGMTPEAGTFFALRPFMECKLRKVSAALEEKCRFSRTRPFFRGYGADDGSAEATHAHKSRHGDNETVSLSSGIVEI